MNGATKQVGILGGGQLALMLCDAARELDIRTCVFATRSDDPAISHADEFREGSFESVDDLVAFFNSCDTVIFENEFIPEPVLKEAASLSKATLQPSADVMTRCANKLMQKQLFDKLGLPSAAYISVDGERDAEDFLRECDERFAAGCVIKWAKGGYDGGGVFLHKPSGDSEQARSFIERAFNVKSAVYAEALISFDTEVALAGIRTATGEFSAYPLVETIQKDGICTNVVGPAYPGLLDKAKNYASKLASELQITGVFAIEYFVCDSELFINEMAPRVHNSGHVTMDCSHTSQFENHLRATLGMPLGKLNHEPRYGMVNILGPAKYYGPLAPPQSDIENTKVHWYEKEESRPGRKIGHLNFWLDEDNDSDFEQLMLQCNQLIDSWRQKIGGQ